MAKDVFLHQTIMDLVEQEEQSTGTPGKPLHPKKSSIVKYSILTICCCSVVVRGSLNHSRQDKGSFSKKQHL